MGEYVRYRGHDVKIGTCEDLYYTTLQQFKNNVHMMKQLSGNAKPEDYLLPNDSRFRFPFPDEKYDIGDYPTHSRGVLFTLPKEFEASLHHLSDCVYKNIAKTNFEVIQQKIVSPDQSDSNEMEVQTVVQCYHCHGKCRLQQYEIVFVGQYILEHPDDFTDLQKQVVAIALQGYNF